MTRKPYPSHFSDAEWEKIKPLLPGPNSLGNPRTVDLREILNAFYRVDNGGKWRAIPHDFPPHQTVYDYFRRWVKTGLWQQINQVLVGQVCQQQGRNAKPSLVIIDSHSVKGTSKGVQKEGLTASKRSKNASGTRKLTGQECMWAGSS